MPFYIFAWLASFFFGLETIVCKILIKHSLKNAWLFNFLWNLLLLILISPFAFFNGLSIPSSWFNVFMAGLCTAVFSSIYIISLYKIDISVASPLFNFKTLFALLFGAILLGERIFAWQYPYIFFLSLAGFFVSYDETFSFNKFFNLTLLMLIFGMAVLALMAFFTNRAIAENGYWNGTFWPMVMTPILLLATLPFFKKEIKNVSSKQIGSLAAISIFGTVGVIASNIAYADNIGITAVIMSVPFSMIIAIIMSAFWPKLLEKHTIKVYAVRLTATAIMILCALKLSI